MESTEHNPPLSRLLQLMNMVEALVLAAAVIGLFFLYDVTKAYWAWDITPFNARFIGAIYAASLVVVVVLALNNRWSPARVIVPMIGLFTVIVLVITLMYWSQFVPSRPATWAWIPLYVLLPLNAAYHLWQYRSLSPAQVIRVPTWIKLILMAQAGVLLVYSLAMFVMPAAATSFWPWAVDAFHSRLYAPIFLAAALGSYMVARGASRMELMGLSMGQAVFGAVAIFGTLYVDSIVKRIDWSQFGAWLFIGIFVIAIILGVAYGVVARGSKTTDL